MNPREYEIMAAVEAQHWWYQSLREILAVSLRKYGQQLPARPAVLDAGCGTGENLKFLASVLQPDYLGGFDASPAAVDFTRQKFPEADVYCSDICDPVLRHDRYDVVVSCDVLCIPGLAPSLNGLRAMTNALGDGGLFLINLPAYMWLKSDHDVAVHTTERFVAGQISSLFQKLGLESRLVTYRLCPLLPLVLASRLPSIMFRRRNQEHAVSALRPAGLLSNGLFGGIMRIENRLIQAGLRMPFGSSVFAVGQKVQHGETRLPEPI